MDLKPKILHVVPVLDPAAGGPSRSVLELARAQAALGYTVELVSGGSGGAQSDGNVIDSEVQSSLLSDGLIVRYGSLLTRRFSIPASSLRSILDSAIQSADIIHLHSLWNGVISHSARLGRLYRKPMIISPRGMLDRHNVKRRGLMKRIFLCLRENDNLEALAGFHFLDETERDGSDWLGPARTLPHIIQPNGLDVANLQRRSVSATIALPEGLCRRERHLVFLGRLNAIKGLELQLEVLAMLRAVGEAVRLHWIGPDDGEWTKLQKLACRLEISDALHWHGPMYGDERLTWLRSADAVLLTSHYECNSVTAAETMALGGVLVATNTCHLDRAARAGAAVVVQREPDLISTTILNLLRDSNAASALREAGVVFAQTELDRLSLAERMLDFYRHILDGRRLCVE